ncbi:MAG: thiamine-phosphate kinase, partial [Dehalococcoidia bacterium]
KLRLGIGDDAAAWRLETTGVEVCTTDTMVEGSHFTRETGSWSDVGWKLWASNLSDVAAMGATPLAGVVTLGLPGDLPVESIDSLYEGMLEACARYNTLLVGGDVVTADKVFITVALTGVCVAEPLTRSAARPGHVVAITGPVGGSRGGLRLLQEGTAPSSDAEAALIRSHRRPTPRVEDGQHLMRDAIRCAMDVSDGLLTDLAKLGRSSGVGAQVRASHVPLPPELLQVFPDDALKLGLGGGEDYQILFTGPRPIVERVLSEMPGAVIIGEITADDPGVVRVLDDDGAEMLVTDAGWEHLR